MLKAAIKHASGEDQVRHRHIPTEAVQRWSKKLEELKEDIAGVLQDEKAGGGMRPDLGRTAIEEDPSQVTGKGLLTYATKTSNGLYVVENVRRRK